VKRIVYREALEKNLPTEINVTRLAVLGDDLYLLDGNSGNVIRAYQTSAGYVVDTTFTCGPSVQGVTVSSPLIDIAAWPAGFLPAADMLAIDSNWNTLLCTKNADPEVLKLAAPTNAAIGNLTGMALDMDDLFVLDPTSNAVWIYWNNQMVNTPEEEPYPFFKDEIPVLSDIVDMIMSGDELHLLHSDGHLTVCVYSGIKEIPTRCSDPTFVDFRPGNVNTPLVPLPQFSQIVYTPPPEPSLYFLRSIEQFTSSASAAWASRRNSTRWRTRTVKQQRLHRPYPQDYIPGDQMKFVARPCLIGQCSRGRLRRV
jgi:hypothetical protein